VCTIKNATLTYNINHTSRPIYACLFILYTVGLGYAPVVGYVAYFRVHLIDYQNHFISQNSCRPAFRFASRSVWNDLSEFVKSSESINIFKCRD